MSEHSYPFCQLHLACADKAEAGAIAKVLLTKHLIACSKELKVSSDFWWKEKLDHNEEVLLIMTSREDLFDAVETEVAKLHSYETYDLQMIPLAKVSAKAATWLEENLTQNKHL